MHRHLNVKKGVLIIVTNCSLSSTRLSWVGREGAVDILTGCGLDCLGIESRFGARYSAPAQTGPWDHPASYTMGTGSFPGVKRPGRGVDHPPRPSAEVKERVKLYVYSTSWPSWPVLGWTLSNFLDILKFTNMTKTRISKVYLENLT